MASTSWAPTPLRSERVVRAAVPLSVVVIVVRSPDRSATCTVPSVPTASTAPLPTFATGLVTFVSNDATPAAGTTYTSPLSEARIAVDAPPRPTCASVGSFAVPRSFESATSTGLSVPRLGSYARTVSACWSTSADVLEETSVLSRACAAVLNRPSSAPVPRVTHTPESLSSTFAVGSPW